MHELKESPWGHGFADEIDQWPWDETMRKIEAMTEHDVERVLTKAGRKQQLTPDDFMALISRAAEPYIEQMAQLSMAFTQERFGKTVSMYIPMYVSNACSHA